MWRGRTGAEVGRTTRALRQQARPRPIGSSASARREVDGQQRGKDRRRWRRSATEMRTSRRAEVTMAALWARVFRDGDRRGAGEASEGSTRDGSGGGRRRTAGDGSRIALNSLASSLLLIPNPTDAHAN